MGSAAARHLSAQGRDVILIGPSEPEDKRQHRGVFGSHYDEGRITRKNALDAFWVEASEASIGRYAEIEAQSGIQFFTETGALMAGPAEYMAQVDAAGGHGAYLDADQLAEHFPFFKFPDGFSGRHEEKAAGHVSPRRLVAAQTEAARRNGAQVVEAIVTGFKERPDHIQIVTQKDTIRVDRVLVAAGYMTDMLLGRSRHMDVYERTVALFEVDEAEAHRLSAMPSLVYSAPESPYLLPPIRYPDGKTYVKLGGDPKDVKLDGEAAIHAWFRSGGNADVRDQLEQMIRKLMPDLAIENVTMDACVTSWTHDRKPEIRALSDKVAVCTGGNGAGAKCSDELGRRGAELVSAEIGETT
jgi:sarcosine oxidase